MWRVIYIRKSGSDQNILICLFIIIDWLVFVSSDDFLTIEKLQVFRVEVGIGILVLNDFFLLVPILFFSSELFLGLFRFLLSYFFLFIFFLKLFLQWQD